MIASELLLLAAFAGLLCGFLNAAASCGSAVSLPILLMMGLDPITANATNRIPVLIGALSATGTFHRGGHVPWRLVWVLSPALLAGTVVGVMLAEVLPSRDLGLAITGAVLVAFLLLIGKLRHRLQDEGGEADFDATMGAVADAIAEVPNRPVKVWHHLLFLGIGIWVGCIVVEGATYMLIGLLLAGGLSLPQGNAAKNAMLIPITLVSLLIFAYEGAVHWEVGGAMAVGSIIGGVVGAKLAVRPEVKVRIFRLLILLVLGELTHLILHYVFKTA